MSNNIIYIFGILNSESQYGVDKIYMYALYVNQVRRGKINERLKCLQDIVPGCYKVIKNQFNFRLSFWIFFFLNS